MICGRERPDDKISVASGSFFFGRTGVEVTQNIRYCNDDPDCAAAATNRAHETPEWAR